MRNPQSIWKTVLEEHRDTIRLIAFAIKRPEKFSWEEVLKPLSAQGYNRIVHKGTVAKIANLESQIANSDTEILVIQDRIKTDSKNRSRFIEAAQQALNYGKGHLYLLDKEGRIVAEFTQGLHSPETLPRVARI